MEGYVALMIPITVLMIPIIAIVTSHKRAMAQIKYSQPMHNSDEVASLRREVAELKEMVHTQMLALDHYAKNPAAPPRDVDLQGRISSGR